MKPTLIVSVVLLTAISVFSQGTVSLNNNIPGVLVTHVYMDSMPGGPRVGNGPGDTPNGVTDYSGSYLLSGNGWSAQLFAARGITTDASSLVPAYPITTFREGADAGFVNPVTATLTDVPADALNATLQLRVWNNEGGTVTDWANASRHGASPLFQVTAIGGQVNSPPVLQGLQSFSMAAIPEPSMVALTMVGTAMLLLGSARRPKRWRLF